MKISPLKKFLVAVIIVSLFASIAQIWTRVKAEKQEDTLNIVADYYTFQTFANSYGHTIFDTAKELAQNGLTGISVPEQSIADLVANGKAAVFSVGSVLSGSAPQNVVSALKQVLKREGVKPFYSVITTDDKDLAERILSCLPQGDNLISSEGLFAVITPIQQTNLQNYGLGFEEEKISAFQKLGLNVVLRPKYAPGNRNIGLLEDTIKKFGIRSVMFYGTVVSGAGSEETKNLADFFVKNRVVTYIVELPIQKGIYPQEGLDVLMRRTHYYVARVYSIYPAEQVKLKPYQIFNRWFRAVSDRNIRVVYVKPIIDSGMGYEYNMKINDAEVSKFHSLWKEKGMKFGVPNPMPEVNVSLLVLLLMLAGVIALTMLYAAEVLDIDDKGTLIWFSVLFALSVSGFLLFGKSGMQKLIALAAAVIVTGVFSLILLGYVKKFYGEKMNAGKVLKHGFVLSVTMFGFSLIGGLWIGAAISSTPFLLNLDMFRGVKVLYLTPFLFLLVNYLSVFGADFDNRHKPEGHYALTEQIEKAWNITVKWGHIIILIMLAGLFLVYLLRSGNTGVPISSAELKFRAFLEHRIVARPRFKEFLVGYPSLFILATFAFLARKKWIIVFSVLGIMGSISIVDTFSHVRDTFLMSLYRSLWGILFGLVIGIVVALILYAPVKKLFANER